MRPNRFIWLGTDKSYEAFTFDFETTEHGWFQAHIYKFDENTSTFIVETTEEVFRAHGLDQADQDQSIAFCEKLFAGVLGGARLQTNARHLRGSAWLNFNHLVCRDWHMFNGKSHVLLMGDAAHTAHFAIGSGTKLAFEDGIELVKQFQKIGDTPEKIPEVLAAFQEVRRIEVAAHPERGAERHGMVRGGRAPLCRHARTRAVPLQHADALAAHQPREPAAARQGLARWLRALVRAARGPQCRPGACGAVRPCSRRCGCAS